MVRKTKEEALATRAGILDAAEHLFQRHGVSATSLQHIADAAGVTRGAVYWHFQNKGDLFNAMMDRVCLPMEDASSEDLDASCEPAPLDRLRAQLLDVLQRVAGDEQVRRVFEIATQKVEYVDELAAVRERHLQARQHFVAGLERCLRTAQRHGQLAARPSARLMAVGLHALVGGLIQDWMLEPASFALVATGRHAIDAYLRGLMTAADGAAAA